MLFNLVCGHILYITKGLFKSIFSTTQNMKITAIRPPSKFLLFKKLRFLSRFAKYNFGGPKLNILGTTSPNFRFGSCQFKIKNES